MYVDGKRGKRAALLTVAVLLLLLAGLVFWAFHGSHGDVAEESAAALRQTILRTALQCYVVEGVYPPSLEYLEENYGIRINTEDFYVVYDAFASNLPPDVRVVYRDE